MYHTVELANSNLAPSSGLSKLKHFQPMGLENCENQTPAATVSRNVVNMVTFSTSLESPWSQLMCEAKSLLNIFVRRMTLARAVKVCADTSDTAGFPALFFHPLSHTLNERIIDGSPFSELPRPKVSCRFACVSFFLLTLAWTLCEGDFTAEGIETSCTPVHTSPTLDSCLQRIVVPQRMSA